MSDTEKKEQGKQENTVSPLQEAYDIVHHVSKDINSIAKKSTLRGFFGLAAAFGSAFLVPGVATLPLIWSVFLAYNAYETRNEIQTLAQNFNDAVQNSGAEVIQHLAPIGKELGEVRGLNIDDINPVKQWEKSKIGVILPYFLTLLNPFFLPATISGVAGITDQKRIKDIGLASIEIEQN